MLEIVARHIDFIDGVFFDFGGVIVHAPTVDDWASLDYCEAQGIDRAFALAEVARMRRACDAGDLPLEDCYRIIAEKAGVKVEPGFADKAADLDYSAWTDLADETWRLMGELRALGKKIGVMSNMSREFWEKRFCKVAGHVRAICDAEVISGLVGCTKPDPKIFALAAERIGCRPERLLFLDDIMSNVEAARACGWRSEQYLLGEGSALK